MAAEPPLTWYMLFKDFQTAIAAVFGFGGVILTLVVNAWLANRKRLDDIDHDRKKTRLALSSELSVIQRSLAAYKETFEELESEGHTELPRSFDADGASRAYRAVLPTIGLLTEKEIQQSVLAYSEYEALSKLTHDLNEQYDEDRTTPFEKKMMFKAYITWLEKTLNAVNEALDSLTEAHVVEKDRKKL